MESDTEHLEGPGWISRPSVKKWTSKNFKSRQEWIIAWLRDQATFGGDWSGEKPTNAEIVAAVREHPEFEGLFVDPSPSLPPRVDTAFLTRNGSKYEVFFTEHGKPINVVQFDDLLSAIKHYLYYCGIT
jgi:hypothetical protein